MKKLKFLVGAVALFALVVVNVWNAATTLRGSELGTADVEALADPESGATCVMMEWFDIPLPANIYDYGSPFYTTEREEHQICLMSLLRNNCNKVGDIRTVSIVIGPLH